MVPLRVLSKAGALEPSRGCPAGRPPQAEPPAHWKLHAVYWPFSALPSGLRPAPSGNVCCSKGQPCPDYGYPLLISRGQLLTRALTAGRAFTPEEAGQAMGLIVEGAVVGCPLGQVVREGCLWASVALLIYGHTWPQPNCSPHLQKTDPGLPPPVPESGPLLRAAGSVTVLKFQF